MQITFVLKQPPALRRNVFWEFGPQDEREDPVNVLQIVNSWSATARIAVLATLGLGIAMSSPVTAQDPVSPNHELDMRFQRLELENKIAKERYGAPVTPKAGDIAGADKLAALAALLQPNAYETLAGTIAGGLEGEKLAGPLVLTTRNNFGQLIVSARAVHAEVRRLIGIGDNLDGTPRPQIFGSVTAVSAFAVLGALETVVGLFRADYAASGAAVDANEPGLLLAIHRACLIKKLECRVDGIDLVPHRPASPNVAASPAVPAGSTAAAAVTDDENTELDKLLEQLALKRAEIAAIAQKDETLAEKNAQAQRTAFVTAADAMIIAMRSPGDTGVAPLSQVTTLLQLARDMAGVVYLDVIQMSATTVTSKRLFSRNAKVHLHLAGLVNVVLQDTAGELRRSGTLTVGESSILNLRTLEQNEGPALSVVTSTAF
jgi:hypothetical protein